MSTAPLEHPNGSGPTGDQDSGEVVGVLLAAGAGRRAGGPKALRVDPGGTFWLLRSIAVLLDGGCAAVLVVLGCAAEQALAIIDDAESDRRVTVAVATDWESGMGASLRTGLVTVGARPWRAALVHLVDLPDVSVPVVRRVLDRAPADTGVLARATYGGRPGHPVLLGRDHLPSVVAELAGDRGAGDYLARHGFDGVECGDLATGRDRDE
ncbi:nucleotidyltransferase family protein [Microlunatus ginsengisoli]|uniref:Nucleotidyltransferase family protein n=1 Tax=Microlunatus ginsengisoli TaxID=363863 RepID=A0ABP7A8F8_9ACTN